MIRVIRKNKYDVLINLQRFGSTGLMTWLSRAKEKIGFSKNPFSFSYDHKVDHEIGNGTHEIHRNLKLIEKWDDSDTLTQPKLYISKETENSVDYLKDSEYIILAPASVWFTKQFPEKKWAEFLKSLSFKGTIYLIGAPSDFATCERIIQEGGRGANLCGKLSLIESVALIKDANMTYVNDSAPMHFASAVNALVCVIFCSTIPDFGFGPLSDKSFIVETEEELSCRPCSIHGQKECPEGHFKCGNNIDVKKLVQVLES